MDTPFLPRGIYTFLYSLLGIVYVSGLFVPLMDNDSAHHANIALRMFQTGDYVNLVDNGKDYLDKPHLHFWLAAWSYHVFGVTSFAYKFPSFIFSILGVYSTFRLGKLLYNIETGRLAALLLATSFAFILSNNDVRMDAILTSAIAFSTWQLVEFIQKNKVLNVLGAALALAIGFSIKGHIAIFIPAVAVLFYLVSERGWKKLFNWKWFLLLLLFALFITPVVYCYYLQFNLHPEKIVRGKNHINGVKFILFNQSIERFDGTMGNDARHDYFFFLHSFLWAFAPWSIMAFMAVAGKIRQVLKKKEEALTIGVFITMLVIVTLSGFKLPHYLNVVFPTTAVLVAAYIIQQRENSKWIRSIFIIQSAVVLLLILLTATINAWAFPVTGITVVTGLIILLAVVFYFIKSSLYNSLQKSVLVPATAMILCFFLLNTSFYPKLLTYQGGNELARITKGKVDPGSAVYCWKETYSSSYQFYTSSLRKEFSDTVLQGSKHIWLLYDIKSEEEIKNSGYKLGQRFETQDYEITKLDLKFINPAKRESQCTKLVLAEILK